MLSDTKSPSLWTAPKLAVHALNTASEAAAIELARQLNITFFSAQQRPATNSVWLLQLGGELPTLRRPDGVSWTIDFRSGKSLRRAREANAIKQPIARALGLSNLSQAQREQWHIIDGTAGAGADAWQLASVGANVTLIEQNSLLHTMLQAGLEAAANDSRCAATASRCYAMCDNLQTLLRDAHRPLGGRQALPPSAIYLDPMYPPRRSSAAVKKPMQFIQALVGEGPAPEPLLAACLEELSRTDLHRVVVKRPAEANSLPTPHFWQGQQISISAGAARFDVYLTP